MFSHSSRSFSEMASEGSSSQPAAKRRGGGVRLSTDPQSVAARQRRHRISNRFKILQSLVPGGTKMDTVSMLEEAIQYVKFLKTQIWLHQAVMASQQQQHEDYQPLSSFLDACPPPPPQLSSCPSAPALPPLPPSFSQAEEPAFPYFFSSGDY